MLHCYVFGVHLFTSKMMSPVLQECKKSFSNGFHLSHARLSSSSPPSLSLSLSLSIYIYIYIHPWPTHFLFSNIYISLTLFLFLSLSLSLRKCSIGFEKQYTRKNGLGSYAFLGHCSTASGLCRVEHHINACHAIWHEPPYSRRLPASFCNHSNRSFCIFHGVVTIKTQELIFIHHGFTLSHFACLVLGGFRLFKQEFLFDFLNWA